MTNKAQKVRRIGKGVLLPEDFSSVGMTLEQVDEPEEPHIMLHSLMWTPAGGGFELAIRSVVMNKYGVFDPFIPVSYSYDSLGDGDEELVVDNEWTWIPPSPWFHEPGMNVPQFVRKGAINSVIKKGRPGGVRVHVAKPNLPSQILRGAGVKATHEGLSLFWRYTPGK